MSVKAFFEAYVDVETLAPLVREIGWSHNLVILERCKDVLEREFYLRMTRRYGYELMAIAPRPFSCYSILTCSFSHFKQSYSGVYFSHITAYRNSVLSHQAPYMSY